MIHYCHVRKKRPKSVEQEVQDIETETEDSRPEQYALYKSTFYLLAYFTPNVMNCEPILAICGQVCTVKLDFSEKVMIMPLVYIF